MNKARADMFMMRLNSVAFGEPLENAFLERHPVEGVFIYSTV